MAIILNGQLSDSSADSADQQQHPDSFLLQQMNAGDEASFELLFQRHYQRIYGLVFRLIGNRDEAEDIVQDVFIRLHQRPPSDARAEHNVSAWLYRVATNTAYNAVRSRNRLWQRNQHLVPDEKDTTAGPEKSAELREEVDLVRTALAQLTPMHGQLLLLRQLGLSYAELAEACDMNRSSVGKTLSRAADAFRDAYSAIEQNIEGRRQNHE
ncbi:MAG: sigma-70 family RNA polymerase sigma factor [Chloroflexota bacterium]